MKARSHSSQTSTARLCLLYTIAGNVRTAFFNSCNDRGNQFVSGFVTSLWRKTDEHFHAWILYQ